MGKGKVWVNLAIEGGVPLFKKFAMFDSGLVPVERTCRDAALFRRCRIPSLRMDLFIGEPAADLGDIAEETPEGLRYNWEKSDRLVKALRDNGVSPYYSWCYVPRPVQPEGGNFRSIPADWEKYREIMRNFSGHYRQMGCPLGYQEIYNESVNPGAFFDGGPEDYHLLYEYGALGIREGDPDALVGGPAEAFVLPPYECRVNASRFLDYIQKKELPLDFFSFHTYGFREKIYLDRLRLMRGVLAGREYFNHAGIHVNEMNTVPPPWPYRKTILEQQALLPQIFTMMEDFLEETDVELVHWAQMLDSGVDALGLTDHLGRLRPGYFAFELYARMPAGRAACCCDDRLGCMASVDEQRFAAVVWNKSEEVMELTEDICGIPAVFDQADVCIVDARFLDGLTQDPGLRLQKNMCLPVRGGKASLAGIQLGISDVLYVEGNTAGPGKMVINPGLRIRQTLHYYPDRWKRCYAEYDSDSGRVYLGANGCGGRLTIVSLKIQGAGGKLTVKRTRLSGEANLAVRMDYYTSEYVKAVQFGGGVQEKHSMEAKHSAEAEYSGDAGYFNANFSRGTKRPADYLAEEVEGILDLGRYAPADWKGEGLLSFLAADATDNYRETVQLAAPVSRAFSSLLD